MSDQSKHLTAQEVEEQKKLAQRNAQAQVQAQTIGGGEQQPQQQQEAPVTGEGVVKIILKTQFLSIEITDPNILAELNTPEKYAQNIPFKGLEININPNGARVVLNTEDRKEVIRAAMSGVKKSEMQEVKHFSVERGPNAPMPQNQQPQ